MHIASSATASVEYPAAFLTMIPLFSHSFMSMWSNPVNAIDNIFSLGQASMNSLFNGILLSTTISASDALSIFFSGHLSGYIITSCPANLNELHSFSILSTDNPNGSKILSSYTFY